MALLVLPLHGGLALGVSGDGEDAARPSSLSSHRSIESKEQLDLVVNGFELAVVMKSAKLTWIWRDRDRHAGTSDKFFSLPLAHRCF